MNVLPCHCRTEWAPNLFTCLTVAAAETVWTRTLNPIQPIYCGQKNVDVVAPCERTFHLNKFISPRGRTPVGSMSVRTSRNALKSMEDLRNGFKSICVWIMADWMLSNQNYEQIRINVSLHPIFQINLSEDSQILDICEFYFLRSCAQPWGQCDPPAPNTWPVTKWSWILIFILR